MDKKRNFMANPPVLQSMPSTSRDISKMVLPNLNESNGNGLNRFLAPVRQPYMSDKMYSAEFDRALKQWHSNQEGDGEASNQKTEGQSLPKSLFKMQSYKTTNKPAPVQQQATGIVRKQRQGEKYDYLSIPMLKCKKTVKPRIIVPTPKMLKNDITKQLMMKAYHEHMRRKATSISKIMDIPRPRPLPEQHPLDAPTMDDECDEEYDDSDVDSSDSEEDNTVCTETYLGSATASEDPYNLQEGCEQVMQANARVDAANSFFGKSLFPHVPAYINFSLEKRPGVEAPPVMRSLLRFKICKNTPNLIRDILRNNGMRLFFRTKRFMGVWGRQPRDSWYKTLLSHQKINHMPASFALGRKDACWRYLQKKVRSHGERCFGVMPQTFILPADAAEMLKQAPQQAKCRSKWIVKPPASTRGKGIRVINNWADICINKSQIVQKYIERPLLINGTKFDLRLYVLVTSAHPLRVYIYRNGLARFASLSYNCQEHMLGERYIHVTNYSVQKYSKTYDVNDDAFACKGHKWTLKSLLPVLAQSGVRIGQLWKNLERLILRTLLAAEGVIGDAMNLYVGSRYSCFELFGFDILLDEQQRPWLLEVNVSPSLHTESPLDTHVKAPLAQAVLNTALFHLPPKLSPEQQRRVAAHMGYSDMHICQDPRIYAKFLSDAERHKHRRFTSGSLVERKVYLTKILEELTPDDVRCLLTGEDELERCSPLERIFPTEHTHTLLKCTEMARYYNQLCDAWEHKYANDRSAGIERLRKYCAKGMHLNVPEKYLTPVGKPTKVLRVNVKNASTRK